MTWQYFCCIIACDSAKGTCSIFGAKDTMAVSLLLRYDCDITPLVSLPTWLYQCWRSNLVVDAGYSHGDLWEETREVLSSITQDYLLGRHQHTTTCLSPSLPFSLILSLILWTILGDLWTINQGIRWRLMPDNSAIYEVIWWCDRQSWTADAMPQFVPTDWLITSLCNIHGTNIAIISKTW